MSETVHCLKKSPIVADSHTHNKTKMRFSNTCKALVSCIILVIIANSYSNLLLSICLFACSSFTTKTVHTYQHVYTYALLHLDAVSFKFDECTVQEDEAKVHIEVILERPATSNRTIQFHSYRAGDNATGELYVNILHTICSYEILHTRLSICCMHI